MAYPHAGESPGEVPHGVAVEQAAKFPSEEMKQLKQELQSRAWVLRAAKWDVTLSNAQPKDCVFPSRYFLP